MGVLISTVGGTSVGYGGVVDETKVGPWLVDVGGAEYGVGGPTDFMVTPVASADRTVQISLGNAWGLGVRDTLPAPLNLQLPTISSGTRWDLVVVSRSATGPGGTTSIDSLTATPAGDIPVGRTVLQQPLALVQLTYGQSIPTAVIDLRVWQANGGAVAVSEKVLQYLTRPGTTVRIESVLWQRLVSTSGVASWDRRELGSIPLLAWHAPVQGGATPAVGTDFKFQAGYVQVITDLGGVAPVFFPVPFPNGLLSITATLLGARGVNDPTAFQMVLYSAEAGIVGYRPSRGVFVARIFDGATGASFGNGAFGISYIAIGW